MVTTVYELKIDRLLDMLGEEAAQSERSGYDFPLTIVFVERKVQVIHVYMVGNCMQTCKA